MRHGFQLRTMVVLAGLAAVLMACGQNVASEQSSQAQPTPTAQATKASPTPTPKPAVSDAALKVMSVAGSQSAIAFIDGTDLHDMGKDLKEASEINSRYAGTVGKVMAVSKSAPWPKELSKEYAAFENDLKALHSALDEKDQKAAAEAAEKAHETQHNLSKGFYKWLDAQKVDSSLASMHNGASFDHYAACVGLQSAIAYIDGAGLHDMGEDLKEAKEINSRYAGNVSELITIGKHAPWPKELSKEYAAFENDLKALHSALAANNQKAAAEAADRVHETQHDLSKGFYAYYAKMNHMMSMMPSSMHDASEQMEKVGVQSAIAFIDSAGLHAMGEDLKEAKEIKSSYASTVDKLITVGSKTLWPKGAAKEYAAFETDLKALKDALAKKDQKAAAAAADKVHETQHNLSNASYAMLGMAGH